MYQPEAVESVDFLFDQNGVKHRTKKYELPKERNLKVVLRRGQPFTVKINIKGTDETIKKSDIWVVFTLGASPNTDDGTKGMAKIKFEKQDSEDKPTGWDAVVEKTEGNSYFVQVHSPSNTPVSIWNFNIETETTEGRKTLFSAPNSICILFNPWMEADLVHMSETELLNEYVLSDVGKVWRGSKVQDAKGYPWVYGQFDECVLPVCMTILKQVPESKRGDPIKVVRIISKMVNANDQDGGVLYGKWNEVTDGTPPLAWTGSIAIFEEYHRTNTGVKWGQCWVFAALVTTVCRALGIPCRNVSNFESAHDTNGSCTIEYYLDKNNKPDPTKKKETVWNFHVWNDVWMARPDLPKGYGGWQAIDATPQETSEGYFQCGPAPVEAVRNGIINLKYDVPFIVAEVNADVLYLKEDPDSESGYKKIDQYQRNVGQGLFTKKPGKFDPKGDSDRDDVMNEYKHPEGTPEERACYLTAVASCTEGRRLLNIPNNTDLELLFELIENEEVSLGKSFQAQVKIVNKSIEDRKILVWLEVLSIYYNGVKGKQIKESEEEYLVKANTDLIVTLSIEPEEYLDKLVGQGMVKTRSSAFVPDKNLTWFGEDDLKIMKPRVDITVPKEIKKGAEASMTLKFMNPLNKHLTKAKFYISAPGLIRPTSLPLKTAEPLGEISIKTTFVPTKTGSFPLVATFNSKELQDVRGSIVVHCIDA